MLSKEEHIVLGHYVKEGLSKTAIVKTFGINRRTAQTSQSFELRCCQRPNRGAI